MRWLPALIMAPVMILAVPAWSASYTPANDAQVLERVPSARDPRRLELQALRRNLDAAPNNIERVTRYARMAIERGRELGDPRYFGYAQAALTPWREAPSPPLEVRVLRATLLQQRHDFAGALTELDRVLEQHPDSGQARLTRATVLLTQGRPREAAADCAALAGRTSGLVLATCLAGAWSVNGRAAEATALLERELASTEADPAVRLWSETLLAEIHQRRGYLAAAATVFERALVRMRESGATDLYLLAAYADFFLEARRPAEIAALLEPYPETDGLLLRKALAAQALPDAESNPALETYRRTLDQRLAQGRARGDEGHLREAAWFELRLNPSEGAALALAARNWQTQREPVDARLLLEAALAAGQPAAAQPALSWMDETGIEDASLAELARALRSPAPR